MPRFSPELKEKIRSEFKAGASKNSLSKKYGVSIGAVFKLCKDLSTENENLVKKQIALKMEIESKSKAEVKAINERISEISKAMEFFSNAAIKNQQKANLFLESVDKIADCESFARTTAKNKEIVLGREPNNQINVNNEIKFVIVRQELGNKD